MKNLILPLFLFCIVFYACKSEVKSEIKTKKITKKAMAFSLNNADNTIAWTAYKTTAKVAVNGKFKKVNIKAGGEGNSIEKAINGVEFSIPVSSIFTKDESRDFKIKKFFFGVMNSTALLSGKLILDDNSSGTAEIKMNGVTEKLPFKYTIKENTFSMTATMNIEKWNAKNALISLNEACKDLHKGEDGVSKTWSEVAIQIVSVFQK